MKKLLTKPHLFFFVCIPVVLTGGFLFEEKTLEITITYIQYVINFKQLSFFIAVFMGLIGVNYFSLVWANKKTKKGLTIFHILLQLISLFLLFTKDSWNWIGPKVVQNEMGSFQNDYSNFLVILSILFFILATLIHLINFFSSLLSKSKLQ